MREGEEATTGTEVVTGDVVDPVITGAVIKERVVDTTEAEVGEGKEEEVVAGAAAFCATLVAWYRAARWRFFSLSAGPRWCGFAAGAGGGGKVGLG